MYELPLGIRVEELLEEVGGEGARAVLVGGASGVLLGPSGFDRTLAYEDIAASGAVVVIGPEREMLDVAKNVLAFFVRQSCGRCTACREGSRRLLDGVREARAGRLSSERLGDLVELGETMRLASKCGLGQRSSSVFLTLVRAFGGELLGRGG